MEFTKPNGKPIPMASNAQTNTNGMAPVAMCIANSSLTWEESHTPITAWKVEHYTNAQPKWYYHPEENAIHHRVDKETTRHSMYPGQSQSQAFHGTGKVVMDSVPNHELQIASVAPQGIKVLLMGIGTSTMSIPTVPIPHTPNWNKPH